MEPLPHIATKNRYSAEPKAEDRDSVLVILVEPWDLASLEVLLGLFSPERAGTSVFS
jgi:hypothetical protein